MPELTFNFTFECEVCGSTLDCEMGVSAVYITPCETCLDAAADAARAEAFDAGRAEGYDAGYSDGLRESDEHREGGE